MELKNYRANDTGLSNVIVIVIYVNAHDVWSLSSFQKNIHRYQKTTIKNENWIRYKKIEFSINRFFKSTVLIIQKFFFFWNKSKKKSSNIFDAKHNKPNWLKSLWTILGYPYYIYESEIPLFQYKSDLRNNENHFSTRESKAWKTCRPYTGV